MLAAHAGCPHSECARACPCAAHVQPMCSPCAARHPSSQGARQPHPCAAALHLEMVRRAWALRPEASRAGPARPHDAALLLRARRASGTRPSLGPARRPRRAREPALLLLLLLLPAWSAPCLLWRAWRGLVG
jgi:hypothetical protein